MPSVYGFKVPWIEPLIVPQTLARLYTKSVVFAHPYLTNIAGKDDHRGLDAHLREMKINLDEELQHER